MTRINDKSTERIPLADWFSYLPTMLSMLASDFTRDGYFIEQMQAVTSKRLVRVVLRVDDQRHAVAFSFDGKSTQRVDDINLV